MPFKQINILIYQQQDVVFLNSHYNYPKLKANPYMFLCDLDCC